MPQPQEYFLFLYLFIHERPLPSRPPIPFDVGGAISEVKMFGPQFAQAEQCCTHSVDKETEAGK